MKTFTHFINTLSTCGYLGEAREAIQLAPTWYEKCWTRKNFVLVRRKAVELEDMAFVRYFCLLIHTSKNLWSEELNTVWNSVGKPIAFPMLNGEPGLYSKQGKAFQVLLKEQEYMSSSFDK